MYSNEGYTPSPPAEGKSLVQALHDAEVLAENELHLPALGYLREQLILAKFEAIRADTGDAIVKAKVERFVKRLATHCKQRAEFYSQLAELLINDQ